VRIQRLAKEAAEDAVMTEVDKVDNEAASSSEAGPSAL